MRRLRPIAVVLLAAAMIGSVVALPALGSGLERGTPGAATDAAVESPVGSEGQAALQNGSDRANAPSATGLEFEPVTVGPSATDGEPPAADGGANARTSIQQAREDVVESGVSEGVAIVQAQASR